MKSFFTGILALLVSAGALSAQNVLDRPVPMTMPIAPERMTLEQMVARADSLHRCNPLRIIGKEKQQEVRACHESVKCQSLFPRVLLWK